MQTIASRRVLPGSVGPTDFDIVVVGAGFFGVSIALAARRAGKRVVLIERSDGILRTASRNNQARVHGGYHYPRSLLTGTRSSANYQHFVDDYSHAISDQITSLYAVARSSSKTSATQFRSFCRRIGAPIENPPSSLTALFDPAMIEESFVVREALFDADAIASRLREEIDAAGVVLLLNEEVHALKSIDGGVVVSTTAGAASGAYRAKRVYLCVYADTNTLLERCGLPGLELEIQMTELTLVRLPTEWQFLGVTVIDGPFFSALPFPQRPGLHSLTHVRFTPRLKGAAVAQSRFAANGESAFDYMVRDAGRFMPSLRRAEHVDSIWERKALLPGRLYDSGRPIIFREFVEMPGVSCVVGGKIDNIYDALRETQLAERGT